MGENWVKEQNNTPKRNILEKFEGSCLELLHITETICRA